MAFIETSSPAAASGQIRELYAGQQTAWGFVPNYARLFCHRPAVMQAWVGLLSTLRASIDKRSFELVTLAAAQASNSSYCSLAHGRVLQAEYFAEPELEAIAAGLACPALTEAEQRMMNLARKVAADASAVTAEDIEELRTVGLSEAEIFDIAAVAAARCFFARLVDGLGAQPDSCFLEMDENLRQLLTVGRSIDRSAPEKLP